MYHQKPRHTKTKSAEKHVLQCTNFAKTLSHINFQVVNGNHLQCKASQFLQLAIHLFYRFHIQTQHFKILRLKHTQKISKILKRISNILKKYSKNLKHTQNISNILTNLSNLSWWSNIFPRLARREVITSISWRFAPTNSLNLNVISYTSRRSIFQGNQQYVKMT